MEIDVFDTHVQTYNGERLHFDVLIPTENRDQAQSKAFAWLAEHGIDAQEVSQQSCAYCHSEIANPEVLQTIQSQGFYIIPLQGFPVK